MDIEERGWELSCMAMEAKGTTICHLQATESGKPGVVHSETLSLRLEV
jgi:hypothetical protein